MTDDRARRRILVAGAAGFLGSHLTDRLISDGHEVIGVDNLQTGHADNLAHLRGESRFEFIEHDVVHPLEVEADDVYSLACPASPVHYQFDPVKTLETSVLGTRQLLLLAERTGARFLLASTSEVYGDPLEHPQTEGYWGNVNPVGPRACYDEGKRAAETLVTDFHRSRGADVRIARIFNTYGPRMAIDDGRVVSNFVVGALRGEALPVYGDGTQTRSFCFVADLIDGLVRLMEHTGPEAHEPTNLGNPVEITILELATKLATLTGSQLDLETAPLPEDDPQRRRPDITRARRRLGWEPTTSLDEGLTLTLEYFRGRLGAAA